MTSPKTSPNSKVMDKESEAMLFAGASVSQLSRLFCLDPRVVKDKLHGCEPVTSRGGHPIYLIKDAAAYLVDPHYTLDEFIAKATKYDLPVQLQKEFWSGMRSRQIFEQAAGDLWPTDKVVEHITELLKTISMSLKIAADKVNRSSSLTPIQRQRVTELMDQALENAHDAVERMINSRTETNGRSTPDDNDDSDL